MSLSPPPPWIPRAVSAAAFAGALLLLGTELRSLSFGALVAETTSVPPAAGALALLLTCVAFLALAGGDGLAARDASPGAGEASRSRRVVLGALEGYAYSLTLGSPLAGSAPVRDRVYAALGMEPQAVREVVERARLSLVTAFLLLLGWGLLGLPGAFPDAVPGPVPSTGGGAALLRLVGAGSLVAGVVIVVRRGSPDRDRIPAVVARLSMALVYWLASAAALFVLLPGEVSVPFVALLGAFLVAHMAGLLSRVPAGLGVFEAVLIWSLGGAVGAAPLLVAVVAFRVVYYVAPLLGAAGLLAVQELGSARESVEGTLRTLGRGASSAVPPILSGTVFVAGAALLATGALPLPADVGEGVLPLPVLEASHFLGSVAGTVLLILAWGLSRRLEAAFHATRVLLALGALLVLLRGGSPALAAVPVVVLLLLGSARREFFRPTALTREPLSADWLLGVALVFACTLWLGFFAYREVAFSGELWWEFALGGDASRFLRGSVGGAAVLLAFAAVRLLSTPEPEEEDGASALTPGIEAIVEGSPRADARLAYLGDKRILTAESNAFIMYGVEGRSWISMGDPVGDPASFPALVWEFRGRTYRHGGWPVFYQGTSDCLPLYVDAGLSVMKLGEAAVVDAQGFGLEGGRRAGMRKTVRKVENGGATFEVLPPAEVPSVLPRLREISDAWLAAKGAREKSFSMGSFSDGYLTRFPHAVVRHEGRITAFANLWLGADHHEFSLDLMRYDPEASPDGVMQFLFARALLWGKELGYRRFSLGMAPLSGLETGPMAPLSARLGAALFRHGEHFYNFRGLRAYKEKFDPVWEPRYLAWPGRLALPRIVAGVASLVSGGVSTPLRRRSRGRAGARDGGAAP